VLGHVPSASEPALSAVEADGVKPVSRLEVGKGRAGCLTRESSNVPLSD